MSKSQAQVSCLLAMCFGAGLIIAGVSWLSPAVALMLCGAAVIAAAVQGLKVAEKLRDR